MLDLIGSRKMMSISPLGIIPGESPGKFTSILTNKKQMEKKKRKGRINQFLLFISKIPVSDPHSNTDNAVACCIQINKNNVR